MRLSRLETSLLYAGRHFMQEADKGGGGGNGDDSKGDDDKGGGKGDDDNNKGDSDQKPAKFEWTPEQQREINRIAAEEREKGRNKGKTEAERARQEQEERDKGNFQSLLTKAEEDNKALRNRIRVSDAKSATASASNTEGAIDPDAIFGLIRDDIEFDDDDKPKNVAALVKALKADKPHLFEARSNGRPRNNSDAGHRGTGKPGRKIDAMIRQAAGRSAE